MNKKILRVVVLALVFLFSLAGISFLTGTDQVDLTSEMKSATLPVVSLKKGETSINRLFGYYGDMNAVNIRDTITPLGEDMVLPVEIQAYQNHVEEISYEVRSLDMERLLEQTQIDGYSQTGGEISTEFHIQNLLEQNQEYRLIITLECGGEKIRYYTRLICTKDSYVDETIDFALDFHRKTFDPEAVGQLATYMESNKEGDNTTLHQVTIHSSMKQLGWADFQGEVLEEPIPAFQEISSNFNVITLNYVMTSIGQNGETEFYNVEEYYRVRYGASNSRMYLLDYHRTMNEIFRGSGDNLMTNGLLLGIRDGDVSYKTNESASVISFTQEGDLWSYNSGTNQMSLVFSFREVEGIGDRENNPNHDIRIIKVDESGNIDFVVYGYMNRGEHEGYTGIGLYHYDSSANSVAEELFISNGEPYQVQKENWAKLFYTSEKGSFYMMAEGDFYKISREDGSAEVVQSGLAADNCAVSGDGRYIAWREPGADHSAVITDLESEKQWEISGALGEIICPIGFIDSDFVYGITDREENGLIRKIQIADKERNVIKEYEKSGCYITEAYVENATVFLKRARKEGDTLRQMEDDAIKSHEIEASLTTRVETVVKGSKQTLVSLTTNKELRKKTPQILTPKLVVLEDKNQVSLDAEPATGRYYVYGAGEVALCTEHVSEAIAAADQLSGVVLLDNQQYIWRRGRASNISVAQQAVLSREQADAAAGMMERSLMAILKTENISFDMGALTGAGASAQEILEEAMPLARVLDLTGCSVIQVLYYVAQGNPVYARGEGGTPVLIVGYDERNVILYNPATNTTSRKGQKDSEEMFEKEGNVFLGYLD